MIPFPSRTVVVSPSTFIIILFPFNKGRPTKTWKEVIKCNILGCRVTKLRAHLCHRKMLVSRGRFYYEEVKIWCLVQSFSPEMSRKTQQFFLKLSLRRGVTLLTFSVESPLPHYLLPSPLFISLLPLLSLYLSPLPSPSPSLSFLFSILFI